MCSSDLNLADCGLNSKPITVPSHPDVDRAFIRPSCKKYTEVYTISMITKLSGFQWDKGNKAKSQKHGVSLETVEGVFSTGVIILPDSGHSFNEIRYRALGKDVDRRSVFVVFTIRDDEICPISARYMHQKEVESYEKDYPDFSKR